MVKFLSFLLFALIIGTSATANACYSEAEAEAEQGLRIHSELMVIGLNCVKMQGGDDTYNKYKTFTSNNADLISKYENAMIDYYTAEGYPNPEEALHSLRTTMANNISEYAVEMSVLSFCDMFSERLNVLEDIDSEQFSEWAKLAVKDNPSGEPKCELN